MEEASFQGRLALKVHSTPEQAFSANFDLQGNASAGSLTFTTPLGSTLARLQWTPTSAVLQTTGQPQPFDSLDALVRHTTGTDLPIASLFAWLQGLDVDTPGWSADLRELPSGRLSAQRLPPDTPVDLKIILDR
jgi:outer membrane lipoprotein LolB